MSGWESPIRITQSDPKIVFPNPADEIGMKMAQDLDNYVVEMVCSVGISVDKEELVKALAYDRDQYEKGFADGRASRDAEIVRCCDCVYNAGKLKVEDYIFCANNDCSMKENGFCSYGERRTDE